jgi:hypothetical protein
MRCCGGLQREGRDAGGGAGGGGGAGQLVSGQGLFWDCCFAHRGALLPRAVGLAVFGGVETLLLFWGEKGQGAWWKRWKRWQQWKQQQQQQQKEKEGAMIGAIKPNEAAAASRSI